MRFSREGQWVRFFVSAVPSSFSPRDEPSLLSVKQNKDATSRTTTVSIENEHLWVELHGFVVVDASFEIVVCRRQTIETVKASVKQFVNG